MKFKVVIFSWKFQLDIALMGTFCVDWIIQSKWLLVSDTVPVLILA